MYLKTPSRARRALLLVLGAAWAAAGLASEDRALLWSVTGPQGHAGYLLGTIHSEDPRVLEFKPEFLDLLRGSRVFAMELVPDLPTLARLADYMRLPVGTHLAEVIGMQRFRAVAQALGGYGLPEEQVARMKPWAAMMTLSVPPPKTGLFMDFSLSLRASGQGLKVIGLETLEQQLAFLEGMPGDEQLALLDQAVREFPRVQEVHDQMVEAYLSDDLQALYRLAHAQLETLDPGARARFLQEGIIERNRRMLETMQPVLVQGGLFTAVGALHLPGEEGLLNLLRGAGYRLQPLASPFADRAAPDRLAMSR
ncbi:MAG: hypothetical protein GTN86_03610 [Xanthomonadales bacterium]|nr:hypothetical protein [Xanthomonadales bacterium]NIN59104.1 hypothetical protein [Xanthomonadales bacterium]NIN74415.1 hypothetical protein [Xanthomonadales bacterium]NIO13218.1 hypothetical protein [Xanthomonadales bacterium]NIP11497.1 hypothetical protein [Xanthomonadales bacterium]